VVRGLDRLKLSAIALQISDNLCTKLSLTRHTRFVIIAIDHKTFEHDIRIDVPARPSQVPKLCPTDPSSPLVMIFIIIVIRAIVKPQLRPQADFE
jgi:hypothetical protein